MVKNVSGQKSEFKITFLKVTFIMRPYNIHILFWNHAVSM